MAESIKVARSLSKTVSAVSTAALDTAYAAAVQALGEGQLIATHFLYDDGTWTICIIYIPA